MSNRPDCFLFAGPTLYRGDGSPIPLPDDVCLRPPVQRGDIPRLLQTERPGTLILVDGLFHQALAVGHTELRDARDAGWQVCGLSSMGAIRAYEMRHLGVRGFGQVYERFSQEPDFQDDEVALLHAPDPPYQAVTEPMIHLRVALEYLCKQRLLTPSDAEAIAADLKSLWYGERLLSDFRARVLACPTPCRTRVREALADFDRFRLKTHDLEAFLQDRVWESLSLGPSWPSFTRRSD